MTLSRKILIPLALAATVWAGAAAAQTQDAERILVRVLPQAEVYGETFTLGEIAELDGFDLKTLRTLSNVRMGRSPLPGRQLRVSEPLIRSRLGELIKKMRVVLIVPRNATVTRAAFHVPGEEIAARVLAAAEEEAGIPVENLQQEIQGRVPDAVLPKGEVDWEIRPLGRRLTRSGGRTYLVVAHVAGVEAWRTTVRLKQKVYRNVVTAKAPIRRNQVISGKDLELVRRAFRGDTEQEYYTATEPVIGQLARRPIGRGEPIHAALLTAPNAVEEGGRVRVIYETANLRLETLGVALVAGQLGQFIPVKNLQSGKIVYGILEHNETVRVN